jgi:hypothetical protein
MSKGQVSIRSTQIIDIYYPMPLAPDSWCEIFRRISHYNLSVLKVHS